MRSILKQEMIEFLKILNRNRGIVIYVTALSLVFFSISLMVRSTQYAIAYIVCALGSLVNLIPIEKSNGGVACGLKKIFYVLVFTIASLWFIIH